MALQSFKAMRQEAYDGNGDGLVDKAQGDHIFIEAGAGGVSAFAVVMMALDGTVLPGNSSEPSHFGKIIGISNSQKLEGEECDIQASGYIQNDNWNLDPGEAYFLGSGGDLTLTPPDFGFFQKIGVAKDSVTLLIQLSEPVMRC
jgi:hypothetical protein